MDANKKKLALEMIESLQFIAGEDEKEHTRLKRLEIQRYQPVGESSMQYHLKVLKELVGEIC